MNCKVISICEGACRSFQNRLDAFRRDELPPDAMRLLLRHVLWCRRCLRMLRIREQTEERVSAALHGEIPPPELADRIIDRIRAETQA